MPIDTKFERMSAGNQLVGLRVLFPNGSIDQDNRQAAARTIAAIHSIPPIRFLMAAITMNAFLSGTISSSAYLNAAITSAPYLNGTITTDE